MIQTRTAAASPLYVSEGGFEALLANADADCAYLGVFNAQRHLVAPPIFVSRRHVETSPTILSSIYELLFRAKPVPVSAHCFLIEIESFGVYWRAALLRAPEKAGFEQTLSWGVEAALRTAAERNRNVAAVQSLARERRHVAPWGFAIVDRDLRVESAWTSPCAHDLLERLRTRSQLPAFIDLPLRSVLTGWDWNDVDRCSPQGFSPIPECAVRVSPMQSRERVSAAVIIEGLELRDGLDASMRRFHVSGREREVLALLFQGYRDREIAARLALALSTVQDHIRHVVAKTRTRTRLEMAARILGWR